MEKEAFRDLKKTVVLAGVISEIPFTSYLFINVMDFIGKKAIPSNMFALVG